MLKAKSRWVVSQSNEQLIDQLVNELQLTPLVAKLLVNRGIETVADAKAFLYCDYDFYDPFLLHDMDICVERIYQAIRNGEKIMVYGDYDADGVSSTYVLLKTLRDIGASCDYYIPNRFTEGYGPNEQAFRTIKANGYDLLITVDNGIAGIHEAEVAKEIGIDLIVTDHHEPGPELPDCLAVIHPKRKDSIYPFKDLAGVGVAFKVASALLGKPPLELLPFVAIGTVGDLVALQDENRLIVKKGLAYLKSTNHLGLQALLKVAGANTQNSNEETIGFSIAPRINAPGRIDHAGIVVDLFLTTNQEEAQYLAAEIDHLNIERQGIVEKITEEAIAQIAESMDLHHDKVLIVGNENWHAGVIGIVASRLVERFYRPVIVLSYDRSTGLAKGSARSIPKFNLYQNLYLSKDLLPHFGGHPMAAGMTLEIADVELLRDRLNDLAEEQLSAEDFTPITEIDGQFPLEEINIQSIEEMQLLAPFGMNNPKPRILVSDVQLPFIKKVGADEKHLKVSISNQETQLDGIGFNLGELAEQVAPGSTVSMVGELGINEWNNTRKPQIFMKDLAIKEWQLFDCRGHRKLDQWIEKIPENNRKFIVFQEKNIQKLNLQAYDSQVELIQSQADAKSCQLDGKDIVLVDLPQSKLSLELLIAGKNISRIYAHFYQEETQYLSTIPTRDHFKWFYAFLLKKGIVDIARYGADLAKYQGLTTSTLNFMTKVFFELEFVTMNNGIVSVVQQPKKRDLTESKLYQQRKEIVTLEKELLFSSYPELKNRFNQMMKMETMKEEPLWI